MDPRAGLLVDEHHLCNLCLALISVHLPFFGLLVNARLFFFFFFFFPLRSIYIHSPSAMAPNCQYLMEGSVHTSGAPVFEVATQGTPPDLPALEARGPCHPGATGL